MVENNDLTQKEVAKKLGITEAAVSRYISNKRGDLEITDKKILNEIKKSSNIIIKKDSENVVIEICKLCNIIRKNELIPGINKSCDTQY